MHRRFKKSNLIRFLGHEATAEEVMHSHAYNRVEKPKHAFLRRRYKLSSDKKTVASYRDSMVGSISQYHDTTPVQARMPEVENNTEEDADTVIGNRPASSTYDTSKKSRSSMERKHHFVEPPKRNLP